MPRHDYTRHKPQAWCTRHTAATERRWFPLLLAPAKTPPICWPLHQHPTTACPPPALLLRQGPRREMKKALEEYWSGGIDGATLLATAAAVDDGAWRAQAAAGIDLVGLDSTLYDQVRLRCVCVCV